MPATTHQRYSVGAIVRIPLDEDTHTYARLLELPLIAFYDSQCSTDLPMARILACPVLFTLWVMKSAVTTGRWRKVGRHPLEASLLVHPVFFRQDALQPQQFFLYQHGQEQPATAAQCRGLERAAVWSPEHAEERLRDHYAGRPNRWVESLKLPGTG